MFSHLSRESLVSRREQQRGVMNNLIKIFPLIMVLVGAASCGSKKGGSEARMPLVQGVKIETVRRQSVDETYEAVGTVRAKATSVVSSKIMGNIVSMKVREGDAVRAGQTLLEIDGREARIQAGKSNAGLVEMNNALDEVDRGLKAAEAQESATEANRRFAASTYQRYQRLLQRQSISPQEFDEVKAKLEIAEAEAERSRRMMQSLQAKRRQVLARIDQAKADVASSRVYSSFTRIGAPISGLVVARQADTGYMAVPGVPLLTIESGTDYRLEAAVQESRISMIHLHDSVGVQIDALGNQEMPGTVVEIVPAADPASRTYLVKISLAPLGNNYQVVRSGLYGKARFVAGQTQVLTVPKSAVVDRGQLTTVFVVDQAGLAHMRLVQTGKTYSETIEILSGLEEGERIVVDGTKVNEGSRVSEPGPGSPVAAR